MISSLYYLPLVYQLHTYTLYTTLLQKAFMSCAKKVLKLISTFIWELNNTLITILMNTVGSFQLTVLCIASFYHETWNLTPADIFQLLWRYLCLKIESSINHQDDLGQLLRILCSVNVNHFEKLCEDHTAILKLALRWQRSYHNKLSIRFNMLQKLQKIVNYTESKHVFL